VSIIRSGRTAETGTLAQLRHLTRTSVTATLATVPPGLASLPGVHDLTVERGKPGEQGAGDGVATVRCQVDSAHLDAVMRHLAEGGIRALVSQPPTLEQIFLRHYASDLTATGEAVR
jgi:ABC-2 type transport system ATP-binding protein